MSNSMHTRLAAFALASLTCVSAQAIDLVPGSATGTVVFGVTPYGNPVNAGNPTYIGNNVNGRTDVLSSPGGGTLGGYLTTNPVNTNNINQIAGPLPGALQQFGGGNASGLFGAGNIALTPTRVGFGLLDVVPGSGSASYGIATWQATFTSQGEVGTFGNWLAISGAVTLPGNAAVASLRTFVQSANPASPFFGGLDLAPLVLAASNNGAAGFNRVAHGGAFANTVAVAGGAYRGLAINSFNVNIPVNDQFVVSSTLTIFADPASIDSIGFDQIADAFGGDPAFAGFALPQIFVAGTDVPLTVPVPEPQILALLLAGLLTVAVKAKHARRNS